MTHNPPPARPRILFFGLPAGVSAAVLAELLAAGVDVAALVLAGQSVPHLRPPDGAVVSRLEPPAAAGVALSGQTGTASTLDVAWAAGLPALAIDDFGHEAALAALAALDAGAAVIACFNRRIPAALLRLPRHGFLNIHPSLLPHYRGPEPLFWQLRDGATTGVTVHYMDEGLDSGDIAAQTAVPLADGIPGAAAEQQLMLTGAELLRGVLDDLGRGVVNRRPQPEGGSYFSFPAEADFTLSTAWPARRAFNFMRGTAGYGLPYTVEVAGRQHLLSSVEHFEPDLELDRLSLQHGRRILIRFNPGILYARLA